MLLVVAPVLQTLLVATEEVKITLLPWQNVIGPFTLIKGAVG